MHTIEEAEEEEAVSAEGESLVPDWFNECTSCKEKRKSYGLFIK